MIFEVRDELEIVLNSDPAIGPAADYDAYVTHGYNEAALDLQGTPARFRVHRLTYDQRKHHDSISGAVADPAKIEFALRAGWRGVTGLQVKTKVGAEAATLPPMTFTEDPRHGALLDSKWLEQRNLPPSLMVALGLFIRQMSELTIPFPVDLPAPCGDSGSSISSTTAAG